MKHCQVGGFYHGPLHQRGGFYGGPRFQRGGAIRGFAGPEYQMGGKWAFGQYLWRHAKPLLSFLGRQALSTGMNIGQDLMQGKELKASAKERLTDTGKNVAIAGLDRVKRKIQTGEGRKKKRRRVQKGRGRKRQRGRGSKAKKRKSGKVKSSVKGRPRTRTARKKKPVSKRRTKAGSKPIRRRRRKQLTDTIFD